MKQLRFLDEEVVQGDRTKEEFEGHCPKCDMVHGVTSCHAFDPKDVMVVGVCY